MIVRAGKTELGGAFGARPGSELLHNLRRAKQSLVNFATHHPKETAAGGSLLLAATAAAFIVPQVLDAQHQVAQNSHIVPQEQINSQIQSYLDIPKNKETFKDIDKPGFHIFDGYQTTIDGKTLDVPPMYVYTYNDTLKGATQNRMVIIPQLNFIVGNTEIGTRLVKDTDGKVIGVDYIEYVGHNSIKIIGHYDTAYGDPNGHNQLKFGAVVITDKQVWDNIVTSWRNHDGAFIGEGDENGGYIGAPGNIRTSTFEGYTLSWGSWPVANGVPKTL